MIVDFAGLILVAWFMARCCRIEREAMDRARMIASARRAWARRQRPATGHPTQWVICARALHAAEATEILEDVMGPDWERRLEIGDIDPPVATACRTVLRHYRGRRSYVEWRPQ